MIQPGQHNHIHFHELGAGGYADEKEPPSLKEIPDVAKAITKCLNMLSIAVFGVDTAERSASASSNSASPH
jgi:hypothetical protein